jgi:hypothetical protein
MLINIAAMPLIAGPIKVRHVCQKNCFLRQKRTYRSARNSLGNIPVVPTSQRGDGERDDYDDNASHGSGTVAAGVSLRNLNNRRSKDFWSRHGCLYRNENHARG